MLWISLMLFSAISICVAQNDGIDCQCVAYFICNKTCTTYDCPGSSPVSWASGDKEPCNCQCENVFDVCCDMSGQRTATNTISDKTPVIDNVETCGRRKVDVDWKICCDDAEDSAFGEFPWMVAILKENPLGGKDFLCGGSIIDPIVILTTAHNIKSLNANQLLVKAGVWNSTDPNEVVQHQNRSVARVLLHPGFSQTKVANDFALLFLEESLSLNEENVEPVCRPSRGLNVDRTNCIATGWGAVRFGNQTLRSVLKKVNLPLIDPTACQDTLRQQTRLGPKFNLHSSFLCAGRENADTCKGDGGGPLMCPTIDDKNRYVQVGITSWGVGCNNGVPGVYSNVKQVSNWIETEIANYYAEISVNLKLSSVP